MFINLPSVYRIKQIEEKINSENHWTEQVICFIKTATKVGRAIKILKRNYVSFVIGQYSLQQYLMHEMFKWWHTALTSQQKHKTLMYGIDITH